MKKRIYFLSVLLLALNCNSQNLTLTQCLEDAKEHNRTLKNAALEIQMAGEQKSEAFTRYFPQISANVMALRTFDKMLPKMDALTGLYGATATLIQPIFAGGQIITGNKLAGINEDVTKLQLQLKEKDIMQKVTENYWQIARLEYDLNTLKADSVQLSAIYKQVQDYVDAGVTTRNDLLKVKLHQQELAKKRLAKENVHTVLILLLAKETGHVGEHICIFDSLSTTPPSPGSLYVNPLDAVQQREELQLAMKGVEACSQQVRMERGKYLPSVAVGVGGGHIGIGGVPQTLQTMLNPNINNGMVFGTVNVPISDWWGGSHAIRRKKMALQEAKNTHDDAQEQLIIDIQSAWSDLTEAYGQIKISEASVSESDENLRMSRDQYSAGTEALTDLLDAETINQQTHNQLSQAYASYAIKVADYLRKTCR